ncbi:MAG: hypothetical protein LBV52_04115 [Spirochaetaceae bacterium]|jgi:hypothetical protein|nr:hypothetical protein [Spirochaetaceae bacterium]
MKKHLSKLAVLITLAALTFTTCNGDSAIGIDADGGSSETGPWSIRISGAVQVPDPAGDGTIPSVSSSHQKANKNETVYISVLIPSGQILSNLTVAKLSGGSVGVTLENATDTEERYTFNMPADTVTVTASYAEPTDATALNADNTLVNLLVAQNTHFTMVSVPDPQNEGDTLQEKFYDGKLDPDIEDSANAEVTTFGVTVPYSGYPAIITALPLGAKSRVVITPVTPLTDNGSTGVATYSIKVTPQRLVYFPEDSTATEKTYTLNVNRLAASDVKTLSSLRIDAAIISFAGTTYSYGTDSAPIEIPASTQTVTLNASTTDHNAIVSVSAVGQTTVNTPADIANATSSVSAQGTVSSSTRKLKFTVTVKAQNRNETQDYVIWLERTQTPVVDNATGGAVSFFTDTADGNKVYEIHTFAINQGDTLVNGQKIENLVFSNSAKKPVSVDVLVVAGGGAGGGAPNDSNSQGSGGGGAGGLIYKTGHVLGDDLSYQIKVGSGGNSTPEVIGENGKDSQFGADTYPKKLIAPGGGGGAKFAPVKPVGTGNGASGGSGGGAVYGRIKGGVVNFTYYKNGEASSSSQQPDNETAYGHPGGGLDTYHQDAKYNSMDHGGGGAGTAGSFAAAISTGANGGIGLQVDISGEARWYAGGGAGSAIENFNPDESYGGKSGNPGDEGTGDGGSGGGHVTGRYTGAAGGSGIVIVRWEYIAN